MTEYDAILVPGGGVREGGRLPEWVARRLDLALRLRGEACIVVLSAGTPYRPPPLDGGGFPIFESVAAARYLVERGVPPERVLIETESYDTLGNAYFSRTIHVEPAGFRRLLAITSEFHLPRMRAAFEWIYTLAPAVPCTLEFQSVPDEGMDPDLLARRVEKERASLESLARLIPLFSTLRDFHRWLFAHHAAYRAAGRGFGAARAPEGALDTY